MGAFIASAVCAKGVSSISGSLSSIQLKRSSLTGSVIWFWLWLWLWLWLDPSWPQNHSATCRMLSSVCAPSRNHDRSSVSSGTTCALPNHSVSARPTTHFSGNVPLAKSLRADSPHGHEAGDTRPHHTRINSMASAALSSWCFPAKPSTSGTPPFVRQSRSGRATVSSQPDTSEARNSKLSIASGTCGDVIAGQFGLNIPAFSLAILPTVSPSTSTWSKPSEVTPQTAGDLITLVASSRPPRPTSRTTASTFIDVKIRNPNKVRNLKYAGIPRSASHVSLSLWCSHQKLRVNVVLETGAPSTR